MPEIKEINLETPSSSGESEQFKAPLIPRKKKKLIKHGSTNPSSLIPRASSANRIETQDHKSLGDNKSKEQSKSLVQFRLRKSLSQMDLKQSRKQNAQLYQRNIYQENYGTVALPKPVLMQNSLATQQDIYYPSKDGLFYVVNEPENGALGAKVAGMKIFATIMLNSWRKRRDDVRRLNREVEEIQRRFIKVKNQVHVLSSIFRNEQKQNEKLSRQLRHATDNINRMQSSIESLTTSLISSKADASLFEQQLNLKEQENESLNNVLTDTNSHLFKSMTQVRHLQTSLSNEQRNVQLLENQKNELLNEINLMEIKWKKEEEQHVAEIYKRDENLAKANAEIKMLESLLMDLKDKEFQLRDFKKLDKKQKDEIKFLQTELNKCFGARMKHFWKNYIQLHQNTVLLIHLGAFYLLPAVPPPRSLKSPFSLSLEKIMSFIRD